MRLLFVTDYYAPLVGGATRAFEQLAVRMAAAGHQVTVATSWQRGAAAVEDREGVAVHRLRDLGSRIPGTSVDDLRHTPPPYPDPELVLRLRSVLRRADPDLVYVFGWITYSLCVALVGNDTPVVFSVRDYGNICPKRSLVRKGQGCSGPGWGKCLACAPELYGPAKAAIATAGVLGGRRLIRRRATATQSCSSFAEAMVLSSLDPRGGARWRRRYVIPDFRDEPVASSLPDGLPADPFILYVGALRDIKGVRVLVEAYEMLAAPRPPLVMIGSRAPETAASFPDGVTVLPPVSNASVLAAWDRALFGVAPSVLAEPLGNVVHEAMSRGKPVIGTTPGGHADMIDDGVNGLLVPAGDVDALTSAISELISDGDLRARLGSAAAPAADAFSAANVFPRFAAMFEQEARTSSRR
jgi:glycosyltransferase involved in cell wall biosynthesis